MRVSWDLYPHSQARRTDIAEPAQSHEHHPDPVRPQSKASWANRVRREIASKEVAVGKVEGHPREPDAQMDGRHSVSCSQDADGRSVRVMDEVESKEELGRVREIRRSARGEQGIEGRKRA